MRSLLAQSSGLFFALGSGYALVDEDLPEGEYELGDRVDLMCMFEVFELLREGKKVGHFFTSGFTIENKGGALLTYMVSKKGKATTSETVLRTPTFVVYSYPNVGAMAISLKVNEHVKSILMEQ